MVTLSDTSETLFSAPEAHTHINTHTYIHNNNNMPSHYTGITRLEEETRHSSETNKSSS